MSDVNLKGILAELADLQEEAETAYDAAAENFWANLSKDDQLMAFYSVVKRIHKGEIIDNGTYRYILYDVFGFNFDSYGVGMVCGFLELHNKIIR